MSLQPSFTGHWLNTDSRNLNEFMKTLRIPWYQIKIAEKFNYGIGKYKQRIEHRDNTIKIIDEGYYKTEFSLPIDGKPYSCVTKGKKQFNKAYWEDNSLVIETRCNNKTVTFKREKINDQMIVTIYAGDIKAQKTYKLI